MILDDKSTKRSKMSIQDFKQYIEKKQWTHIQRLLIKAQGIELTKSIIDNHDNLPLHHAIYHKAPDNILECILHANIEAVFHKNDRLWVPLHMASYIGVSSRFLEVLIQKYPQALDNVDHEGKTPRDLMMDGTILDTEDKFIWNPKAIEMIMKPLSYWVQQQLEVVLREKEALIKRMEKQENQIHNLESMMEEKDLELNDVQMKIRVFLMENDALRQESECYIDELIQQNKDLRFKLETSEKRFYELGRVWKQTCENHSESQDLEIIQVKCKDEKMDDDSVMITPSKTPTNIVNTDGSPCSVIDNERMNTIERRLEAVENQVFFS